MSKDVKKKGTKKKKKQKKLLESTTLVNKYKSKCCEKYMKSENKRCKRCPMFDLIKSLL